MTETKREAKPMVIAEVYPEKGKIITSVLTDTDDIQRRLGETICWQQAHLRFKEQIIKRLEAKLKAKEVIEKRIFCSQN